VSSFRANGRTYYLSGWATSGLQLFFLQPPSQGWVCLLSCFSFKPPLTGTRPSEMALAYEVSSPSSLPNRVTFHLSNLRNSTLFLVHPWHVQ
jgi:hypothetical protein